MPGRRTAPVPWGGLHVVFVAGTFMVALAISHGFIGTAGIGAILAMAPAFLVATASGVAVAAGFGADGLRAAGIRSDRLLRDLARWAGAYVLFLIAWVVFLVFVYTPLLRALGALPPQQDVLRLVQEGWAGASPAQRVALIMTVVVVGPLAEELFFRGLLQPVLTARVGAGAGVVVTALLFGLLHDPVPHLVVPIGLLGCFFGWVRLTTGSVLVPAGLHALHNSITLALFLGVRPLYDLCYNSGR
jgi:membrane protease YdiL (CAAX protease family)